MSLIDIPYRLHVILRNAYQFNENERFYPNLQISVWFAVVLECAILIVIEKMWGIDSLSTFGSLEVQLGSAVWVTTFLVITSVVISNRTRYEIADEWYRNLSEDETSGINIAVLVFYFVSLGLVLWLLLSQFLS